jgi:hypothetical protein
MLYLQSIVNIVIQGTSRSSRWTRWHPRPGPGPRPAAVDLGTPWDGTHVGTMGPPGDEAWFIDVKIHQNMVKFIVNYKGKFNEAHLYIYIYFLTYG